MSALVLGSASPRRAELLAQLGLSFDRRAADIDETPQPDEAPLAYVARMAREKAAALRAAGVAGCLLTADTTVILDRRSLGKPADRDEGRAMLRSLSGRGHEVCTAVCCLAGSERRECSVLTRVEFMPLDDALIEAYLDSDEPWDKAGAYAIQGLGGSFVRRVEGSVSNVIGLPLVETRELLAACGLEARVARA
ncbi:MAG: Maf family protein [Halieaceae bacterium]|jgi:septum formation protein|nr:Maf family protein [Halieaceae bacterium]